MEADWEVEIGSGAAVIDALWDGLVDLRRNSKLVVQLPEVKDLPALEGVLIQLNGSDSPVWTSKCDVWPMLDASEFDADEMEAGPEGALYGWGCYIDLLPKSDQQWIVPEMAVVFCKHLCGRLQAAAQRCCRVDLIVRRAIIAPEVTDYGTTAYITACGTAEREAIQTLEIAVRTFADAVCGGSTIE